MEKMAHNEQEFEKLKQRNLERKTKIAERESLLREFEVVENAEWSVRLICVVY